MERSHPILHLQLRGGHQLDAGRESRALDRWPKYQLNYAEMISFIHSSTKTSLSNGLYLVGYKQGIGSLSLSLSLSHTHTHTHTHTTHCLSKLLSNLLSLVNNSGRSQDHTVPFRYYTFATVPCQIQSYFLFPQLRFFAQKDCTVFYYCLVSGLSLAASDTKVK